MLANANNAASIPNPMVVADYYHRSKSVDTRSPEQIQSDEKQEQLEKHEREKQRVEAHDKWWAAEKLREQAEREQREQRQRDKENNFQIWFGKLTQAVNVNDDTAARQLLNSACKHDASSQQLQPILASVLLNGSEGMVSVFYHAGYRYSLSEINTAFTNNKTFVADICLKEESLFHISSSIRNHYYTLAAHLIMNMPDPAAFYRTKDSFAEVMTPAISAAQPTLIKAYIERYKLLRETEDNYLHVYGRFFGDARENKIKAAQYLLDQFKPDGTFNIDISTAEFKKHKSTFAGIFSKNSTLGILYGSLSKMAGL